MAAAARPFRYEGNINFDFPGNAYAPVPFASGGAGRGSAPYGEWPIQTYQQGSGANYGLTPGGVLQGWPVGTTPSGTMADPQYPGNPRDEIMIHAGRSDDIDQILSAGCLSIPQDQWPAFRDELRAAQQQYGPLVVVLEPNGQATIRPASGSDRAVSADAFIAQSQARTSAATGGATSVAANVPMPNLRPDMNPPTSSSPTLLGNPGGGSTQPNWGWTSGQQMASAQSSPTLASYYTSQRQTPTPQPTATQPQGSFVPDPTGDRFWWDQPPQTEYSAPVGRPGPLDPADFATTLPQRQSPPELPGPAIGDWLPASLRDKNIGDPVDSQFVPPDGQYADYWLGKTFNSPNGQGFDPSKPTAYRDPFGEWSIPDSNDTSGQFSPDQLQSMFTPPMGGYHDYVAPTPQMPTQALAQAFNQAAGSPVYNYPTNVTVKPPAASTAAGNALLGFGGTVPSSAFLPKPAASNAWPLGPLGVPPKQSVFGANPSWLPPKPQTPASGPTMTVAQAPMPPPPPQPSALDRAVAAAQARGAPVNMQATYSADPWAQPGTDDTPVLYDTGYGGGANTNPGFNAFVYG